MSKPSTIFRVAYRTRPFTQIGNEMLRETELSFAARGALAMLITYPPDWEFTLDWFRKMGGGIGKEKAQAILRELATYGYCKRQAKRGASGQLIGQTFLFSDEPTFLEGEGVYLATEENRQTAEPSDGETIDTEAEKPSDGKSAQTNNKRKDKEDRTNIPPAPPKGGRVQKGLSDIPRDWGLSPDLRAWSLAKRPRFVSILDEEVEKFRDYWLSRGKRMKDWDATWRTWWKKACDGARPDALAAQSPRAKRDADFLQLSRELDRQGAAR